MNLTNKIVIEKAKSLGFDIVGFAKAEPLSEEVEELKGWLAKGYHAKMLYMERNVEKRMDAKKILINAKSIISLGMNYFVKGEFSNESDYGKISRYAWGKDYHIIIWKKLGELIENLQEIDPDFIAKGYVDTGPVMDQAWAVRAGIGWRGKNTNIINKKFGSWIFIATLITNYDFEYSIPQTNLCGTCRTCIDACPTNAIVEPYVVDANKCISYLTIENKGDIPNEFNGKMENWIFGCDICQDVCPWNKKFAQQTKVKELSSNIIMEIKFDEIENMKNNQFNKKFAVSPIKRAKLKGLKRNAEVCRLKKR